MMRTCSDCKESKSDDEFYICRNKGKEHGIHDRKCKKCRIAYNTECRRKKQEKINKMEQSSSHNDIIDALVRKVAILEDKMNKTNTRLDLMSDRLDFDHVE